jgi:hypothetical protein
MKPWRCDPYLWVHLAGLATVPLWIDLCLLGLAVGNPTLPELELGVIVALGVLPVLVMQLWQPFYIFCLPGLVVRPGALEDDQLRLLSQFRCLRVRLGALLVPIPLVWALVKLYTLAFLAREMTPFDNWGRLGGLAIAVLGFFLANLFLQVSLAVLQVLVTPERRFQQVLPYPSDRVAADFRLIGLPVGKILPAVAGDYPSEVSTELSRDKAPERTEPRDNLPLQEDGTTNSSRQQSSPWPDEDPIAEVEAVSQRLKNAQAPESVDEVTAEVHQIVNHGEPDDNTNADRSEPVGDGSSYPDSPPLTIVRHPEVDELDVISPSLGDDATALGDSEPVSSLPVDV